ncbi:uncharacterized protein G2W53_003805 [Senna tora]|uniref:Secreted protein n=1 Tax=Senna tora TaxID=362788 RepID=A0A834XBQ3_9FABA|nr:uncharacterized protein G2W53_003805 [Senna tora]
MSGGVVVLSDGWSAAALLLLVALEHGWSRGYGGIVGWLGHECLGLRVRFLKWENKGRRGDFLASFSSEKMAEVEG